MLTLPLVCWKAIRAMQPPRSTTSISWQLRCASECRTALSDNPLTITAINHEKCFHHFTVCLRLHHFISFVLSSLHRMADQFTSHMFSPTDIHLNLPNSFSPLPSIRRIAIDEERLVLAFETLDVESKGKQSNKRGDTHAHICLMVETVVTDWPEHITHTTHICQHTHTHVRRGINFSPDVLTRFILLRLTYP